MNDTSKKTDNCESKTPSTFYLKEALRLSELKIKYQDDVFIAIERKSVLLVTLYIATIGYILSWDDVWGEHYCVKTIAVWGEIYCVTIIIISLVITLAVAALFGACVLYPRYFGGSGANPEYLMESFNYDFNEMATDLLNKRYKKMLNDNDKTLNRKMFLLGISLWLGIGCIIIAVLFRIVIKT